MCCSSGSKEHFYCDDDEDCDHGNGACHGRVRFVPEIWETRVCEGDESRWEEVYEGCRNEDTGAEVPGEEEEAVWYREAREATGYYWE
jgi:hypothetical protein